ncbi:MAG: hypothetical protein HY855_00690 [Burkholderiales bacterium]|nr:hypothetical protein [Burkholderiales bacterium]
MSTTLLTMPALPVERATGAEDDTALPAWVYRSEAFAEDLPRALAPVEVPTPRGTPAQRRWRLPGALYFATLALAVLATVPTTLLTA